MRVYGRNVFNEYKEEPSKIKKVYLNNNNKEIIGFLKENNIRYELCDNDFLNRLEKGNHQGIILEIDEYEYYSLEDILNEKIIVILDHLEDPHNFGAIIRTCEAAGIKGIIIPKDRSVSVNATVMKTSSGTIDKVKIARCTNITSTIKELQDNVFFVYATDMEGTNYRSVDYADKCVLVIGNEGHGVSRLVKDVSDEIIAIPMKGNVNSLNASVAAGIIIYEIIK